MGSIRPRPEPATPAPTREPIDPSQAVIGIMMADGSIHLAPCEVCPWRQVLCDVCIVPSMASDPDINPGWATP